MTETAVGIVQRKHRKFNADQLSYLLLIGPPFVILFLLTIGPFIYSFFYMSLMRWNLGRPSARMFVGLGNYLKMFRDERFWNGIGKTFYFVVGSVGPQVLIAILIALLMSGELRGIGPLRSLYMLPYMVTPIVVGITWRMMMNADFGVVNQFLESVGIEGPNWLGTARLAMPSVITADIWRTTPFMTMFLLAGIQGLPTDPFEAAIVDGASRFQRVWHLTLPLLMPVMVLATLFRTIDSFKAFGIIWVLTSGGPGIATETLNVYSYLTSFQFLNTGYGAALSVAMIAMMLVISLLLLRQLRKQQDLQ